MLFGSRGEKWIAATMLAGNLLTILVEHWAARTFSSVSNAYVVLDMLLAMALCAIAVRFPSWVAICIAAFQVNGAFGHLVKLVAAQTIPFSYAFLLKVWAWPMVIALLVARGAPQLGATLLSRNWPPFAKRE